MGNKTMPDGMNEDRILRYYSLVAPPDERGCMLWLGSISANGYGRMFVKPHRKITLLAHRLAWELKCGAIPRGMYVCHRCDVRACCNPGHLFVGTAQDNMDDKCSKARQVRGEDHGNCTRFTEEEVITARKLYHSGVSVANVARALRTSHSQAHCIIVGKIWKHLPVLDSHTRDPRWKTACGWRAK